MIAMFDELDKEIDKMMKEQDELIDKTAFQ